MRWNRRNSTWYLMLPIASGPIPECTARRDRLAVVLYAKTFKARRWDGVDVGRDLQRLGRSQLFGGEDLGAGPAGAENHLGFSDQVRLQIVRAAVGVGHVHIESGHCVLGGILDAGGPVIADQCDCGAFAGGDDPGGKADHAGGAENTHAAILPAGAAQFLLDAGDHRRRRGERTRRIGEDRDLERREHGLACGLQHVER